MGTSSPCGWSEGDTALAGGFLPGESICQTSLQAEEKSVKLAGSAADKARAAIK
jgi:hypothetical protein